MPKPLVAITVDSVCAATGKCFVSELVSVAEEYTVPMTWLLDVTEHDPLTNVKLYHNEYLHRIPAWHELGLHITFDNSANNTVARGDLIRIGKDILKQFSIKPTAFRAANGDLEPDDLRALEDIGILVDCTAGSSAAQPDGSPKEPYHPSYTELHGSGDARIWEVAVANECGMAAYLDSGFEKLQKVIDARLAVSHILCLGLHDCVDNAANLRSTVDYLRKQGARFTTLTQLVTEL